MAINAETTAGIVSVKYDADEFFSQAAIDTRTRLAQIWYLDNPSAGTADVKVTFNVNCRSRAGVISLQNSAPGMSIISNSGTGTSIGFTTPQANMFVIGCYTLYNNNVSAGVTVYTLTDTVASEPKNALAGFVVPPTAGGNTYAGWIAGFPGVGAQNGLGDDPDGVGTDNGVENFFGTNPGTFSQGMVIGMVSGVTSTITHPQSVTPASNLTASYRWSTNLVDCASVDSNSGQGFAVVALNASDLIAPTTTGCLKPEKPATFTWAFT